MKRILIVDDTRTQAAITRRQLERHGFTTILAGDGLAGVEAARRDHPDLILMDVVMPLMNGFDATRTLSLDPATADIPVVLLTSNDSDIDRARGLRSGARAYLIKPVREATLLEAVRRLLGGSDPEEVREPSVGFGGG